MGLSPRSMPAGTDGEAHLFFTGTHPCRLVAVSTTGCVAIQQPEVPVRVSYWHYRMKKGTEMDIIELPASPWLMLWSCRAAWNSEPCGHITRLHAAECELTAIDVRGLRRLAHLRCPCNRLQRLDCSGMAHLRTLDCSGNELTQLDLAGCSHLERLFVGGNPRLRQAPRELLARARGEPIPLRRHIHLAQTSLFEVERIMVGSACQHHETVPLRSALGALGYGQRRCRLLRQCMTVGRARAQAAATSHL